MSKFKVDNEQVNAAVETLRNLLEKCEEAYEVKIPVSDVDKGQTHDELTSVCENIKSTCYDFGQLIHNTILFLGEASDMFEKSDKDSAAAIKDDTNSFLDTKSNADKQTDIKSTKLNVNMEGYSLNQGAYPEFTKPYGYNAGCCATAYAIGLSIVTGQPTNPIKYWYDGETHYDDGHRSGWISYDSKNIYESLVSGKPTVLAYIYAESPASQTDADHFVIITGIRDGADISNLQYSDFIVIDPASGTERCLSDSWKFNPNRVTGGFVMY